MAFYGDLRRRRTRHQRYLWRQHRHGYVCLYQSAGGGNDVLLYRTVRHCRDYKGGYNRYLTCRDLKKWSYLHLLDTLSALRKDRADDERAA